MTKIKNMTGYEVREELRRLAEPRLRKEKENRDAFLKALFHKGY